MISHAKWLPRKSLVMLRDVQGHLETHAFDSYQNPTRGLNRHEVEAGGLEDKTP
jgi:hypothetical protein